MTDWGLLLFHISLKHGKIYSVTLSEYVFLATYYLQTKFILNLPLQEKKHSDVQIIIPLILCHV